MHLNYTPQIISIAAAAAAATGGGEHLSARVQPYQPWQTAFTSFNPFFGIGCLL